MNKLSQLSYLAWWFFRARFLGRRKPLQSVVFITSGCDSTCRHCSVCTTPSAYFKSFQEIQQDLDYCYSQGSRMLDVEGVEMLHWKSGTHTINDVFQMAYDKGFYSTSTMIPAADYAQWQKLGVKVDVLWVSILHFSDTSLLENLKDASLYMVINAQNYQEVPAVLEFLQNHKGVQKIAFNFHTPFSGTASMALDHNQRKEVFRSLITDGLPQDLALIYKTLTVRRKELEENSRKLRSADEGFLKECEKLLSFEISYAQGCSSSEAKALIISLCS